MDALKEMSSGRWHNGFNGKIGESLESAADLCFLLNSLPPSAKKKRKEVLRGLLGNIGEDCIIHSPFRCDIGNNIRIGDRVICNFNLSILDEALVEIGDDVFIGPNTTICTITHSLDREERVKGVMRALPIKIGDGAWLGAGVTIMPGVEIGEGSVVGACSLVTKNIPSGVLAFGSPCHVVRKLTPDNKRVP
ncbi:MAG: sugar O-acetyltransferase [Muribaculaceae bacterium]